MIFCACYFSVVAQIEFESYSKSDSLTSINISSVFVDSKGVIWAATNNGVNAFTGKRWVGIKSISKSRGNDINLGTISNISETKNTSIWISSDKGLFEFNGKYWTHHSDRDNSGFYVKEIIQDSLGFVWIVLEKNRSIKDAGDLGFSLVEGKLQMYNHKQWYDFPGMIGGSAAVVVGEKKEYFTSSLIDSKNNLWITSLDGLYIYNQKSWLEYDIEYLSSDKCYKVFETSKNDIWVGTANGVAKRDGDKWIKYEDDSGIKDNDIYNLFEDKKQRLWAFSKKDNKFKALNLFRNNKWEAYFDQDLNIKGEVKELFDFYNKLLAYSNKGISIFDKGKWTNLEELYGIEEEDYSEIIMAKDSSVWFTTKTGLYHLNKGKLDKVYTPKKKWRLSYLYEAPKGDIWLGTEKNGVYIINEQTNTHLTSKKGLVHKHIKNIFTDSGGSIWIVSKEGISKYLGK